jgi:hypothetical protein
MFRSGKVAQCHFRDPSVRQLEATAFYPVVPLRATIGIYRTLLRAYIKLFAISIRADAAQTPFQTVRPLRGAIGDTKGIQFAAAITCEQKSIPKPWPL